MKLYLTIKLLFPLLLVSLIFPQEVKVTLSGNTTAQGFSIVDNTDKTLFRVRGDGTSGFGTDLPTGYFDILATPTSSEDGKSINIFGQSTSLPFGYGGDINLISGDSYGTGDGTSGDINILTASSAPNTYFSGDINIKCGYAEAVGGNINITSGGGQGYGGNVNIKTELSEDSSGHIELLTGDAAFGASGDINIKTGTSRFGESKILISCGLTYDVGDGSNIELYSGESSNENGGDIIIASGDGGNNGGNIILTPGTGIGSLNGKVIVNGSGTYSGSWTFASDRRFKKNIEPLVNSVDKIEQLNGVSYELRQEEFPEKHFSKARQIGLIAQDVEKVLPELVDTDSDGYKSIAYQNLVAVLVEAVKEQQSSIEKLKKEFVLLKSSLNRKNDEVSSLGN